MNRIASDSFDESDDLNSSDGTGLALSAGGARGAYQIGCWKAFLERGIGFSAISGSSIGALNAALICRGDWDEGFALWTELSEARILRPDYVKLRKAAIAVAVDLGLLLAPLPAIRGLKIVRYLAVAMRTVSRHGTAGALLRDGLWNMERHRTLLERHLDMSEVVNSQTDMYVTAFTRPDVNGPLGRPRVFKLQEHSEKEAWTFLRASMALPVVFPSVKLEGKRHVDGGIGMWLPIQPLHELGLKLIVAVSTKTGIRVKPDQYPGTRIILIKPSEPLGRFPVATFRFTEEAIGRWMELGYTDASRVLDREGVLLKVPRDC